MKITLRNILIFSIIVLLSFEVYLRFFASSGYLTPEIHRNRSLPKTSTQFARYIFPTKAELNNDDDDAVVKENYRKWNINNLGYRGPDLSFEKPDSVVRIIIYGCQAVRPPGEDWPRRVERILRNNGNSMIEVINASSPGHSSLDAFSKFFTEGHLLRPDYVISYHQWNDIAYFKVQKPVLRALKPQEKDPRMHYQGIFDRFLCERSQLFVRLRYWYYDWILSRKSEVEEGSRELGHIGPEQYELSLQMFIDLARRINAIPILMTQGRLVKRENSQAEQARIKYDHVKLSHQKLCDAFELTDKIIKRVAKNNNVHLIDAAKYLPGSVEYFDDEVHLNERGAERLSILTANSLQRIMVGSKR